MTGQYSSAAAAAAPAAAGAAAVAAAEYGAARRPQRTALTDWLREPTHDLEAEVLLRYTHLIIPLYVNRPSPRPPPPAPPA